jgi:Na+/proline symporter
MTGTAVSFSGVDWAVVAAYFIANTAICVWAALLNEKDTTDYFLASRSAGSGAGSGMAIAHWELHS